MFAFLYKVMQLRQSYWILLEAKFEDKSGTYHNDWCLTLESFKGLVSTDLTWKLSIVQLRVPPFLKSTFADACVVVKGQGGTNLWLRTVYRQ